MKKLFLLTIALFLMNTSFAQNQAKEIDMKVNFWGLKFIQDDKSLSWKELVNATESNYDANLLIKKARTHNTISDITGLIGGGLIGFPIGQSISDGDANWTLAYIGGGIALISIPFSFSAFNKVNKGIDDYNRSLNSNAYRFQPEFELVANGNGIGFIMRF